MLQDIKKDAKQRMEKSAEALKSSLTKIRTGRASPAILDHVKVDYYGTETPLKQVANVTATDARSLSITPWERPNGPGY
jgi:ribosome recycling factor